MNEIGVKNSKNYSYIVYLGKILQKLLILYK